MARNVSKNATQKKGSVLVEFINPPRFGDNNISSLTQYAQISGNTVKQKEERYKRVAQAIGDARNTDRLKVHYQPIYNSKTGKIHSAEALARLKDPELGMVFPDEFIAVAEQTGDIAWIGEYVFGHACSFLASGGGDAYGLKTMEINLSTIQCLDPELPQKFSSIAASNHISPAHINLEITETAEVYSKAGMFNTMENLIKAGFSFALDDFGTGYANYSYLVNYPFQLVKVDKSFLWEAGKSPENRIVFENMLQLIEKLGKKAVVEGVETKQQLDFLIGAGVDYLQGYYYSKPIPGKQLISCIKEHNSK